YCESNNLFRVGQPAPTRGTASVCDALSLGRRHRGGAYGDHDSRADRCPRVYCQPDAADVSTTVRPDSMHHQRAMEVVDPSMLPLSDNFSGGVDRVEKRERQKGLCPHAEPPWMHAGRCFPAVGPLRKESLCSMTISMCTTSSSGCKNA